MYHPYPDDQNQAILKARQLLGQNPLFLDTETTGMADTGEICEIAIIDATGAVLINTLVRPTRPIPQNVVDIHGITNEMVQDAPTFKELLPELNRILKDRVVLIYNASFDEAVISNSVLANQIRWDSDKDGDFLVWWFQPSLHESRWHCAMELYATYYGEFNSYHGSYRWQRLSNAALQCGIDLPLSVHRALADAEMTRRIMLHVADMEPGLISHSTDETPVE